ncbi:MAG: sugar nucleotide-binding protein [Candidatus Marinimicrobia bacterium]|nr:sugar nucleotide-binding protein [Candidatus Neomarinimicrobiota bacterium]
MKGHIFILGSQGFVGSHLSRYYKQLGYPIFDSHKFMLRIENHSHIERIFGLIQPDYIIHSINYYNLLNREQIFEGLKTISNICKQNSIHFIHISCDTIFNPQINSYSENYEISQNSLKDNNLAELEILLTTLFPADLLSIVRSATLWSENMETAHKDRNFLARIFYALDSGKLGLNNNHIREILHWKSLADGLLKIEKPGIYHFSEKSKLSHYALAIKLAEALGIENWMIHRHLIAEISQNNSNIILDTQVTEKKLGFHFSETEDIINYVLKKQSRKKT